MRTNQVECIHSHLSALEKRLGFLHFTMGYYIIVKTKDRTWIALSAFFFYAQAAHNIKKLIFGGVQPLAS